MRQKNQDQINKYNIRKNSKREDYNYKVGYKFNVTNNAAFGHETPYNWPPPSASPTMETHIHRINVKRESSGITDCQSILECSKIRVMIYLLMSYASKYYK